MAASNSTNGQRSGEFIESLPNAAPQVVPSLPKSGNEDEDVKDETHEDVETSEPVDSELPAVSNDGLAHFVAELAVVSTHEDLDHHMPDAPPLDAGVPGGVDEDHPMPDAPGLNSADTKESVEDVVMEDAPPFNGEGEE